MKKIIEGRKYNTDTATKVGTWDNEYGASDFNYVEETLYRKQNGEFFIHGEGGANSRYAKSAGLNSWTGGEMIEPQTFESARKWAEEHLTAEEYDAVFGDPGEGEDILISVTISPQAKSLLNKTMSETGQKQSDIIENLVREHL